MILIAILLCVIFALIAIGAFWLSVEEKKRRKDLENEIYSDKAIMRKYNEEKIENEKIMDKASSGNNADSFNASIELVQKLSEKGNKRNNKS